MWAFYEAEAGEILDTWHTMGMRGTGSHDIVAEDVFVPEHRMARPRPLTDPGQAFRGPLYRTTIWPAVAALAPPALGIAQSAIELLIELGSKKKPNYFAHSLGERPVVQSQLAEAEAIVGAARAYQYESLNEAYESALEGRLINEQQKIKAHLATCYAIRSSADAVVCRAIWSAGQGQRRFERHRRLKSISAMCRSLPSTPTRLRRGMSRWDSSCSAWNVIGGSARCSDERHGCGKSHDTQALIETFHSDTLCFKIEVTEPTVKLFDFFSALISIASSNPAAYQAVRFQRGSVSARPRFRRLSVTNEPSRLSAGSCLEYE